MCIWISERACNNVLVWVREIVYGFIGILYLNIQVLWDTIKS